MSVPVHGGQASSRSTGARTANAGAPRPFWRRVQFDLLEAVLILLVVVLGTLAVAFSSGRGRTPPNAGEYEWFRASYGPTRTSEDAEEWILRDYFKDRKGGFFVDIGANDPRAFSNTYYLENALAWSGIAVDANPVFAESYASQRPGTRFFSFFISDQSDRTTTLFVPDRNHLVASESKEFTDRYDSTGTPQEVRTITLDDLLDREQVTRIDFLTMDIELAEPKALAGFDIVRFRPELVCVEGHAEVRQQIMDYFARHGYRLIGRYLRADDSNLWYVRGDLPVPESLAIHSH